MQAAAALWRGFDRVVKEGGWRLVGILAVLVLFAGIPVVITSGSRFLVGIITVVAFLLSMMVAVIAFQVFTDYDPTAVLTLSIDDGIGFETIHMLAGIIVSTAIISIGFLLIIPGIYLLVSLLFWPVRVATEREDVLDAFRKSWGMTQGRKWSLLFLVLGILVVAVVANIFVGVLALVAPPVIQLALFSTVNAFVIIFGIAAVSDAYTQITSDM